MSPPLIRATGDLRGKRLIHLQPRRPVSDFPQRHIDGASDLLHLLVINLVCRVARTMIVLVNAVKEEDDRNSLTCVVVMIAAEEEPVWILWIVVLRIVGDLQI